MKSVVQVVKSASLYIDEKVYSSINQGLLVLVGFCNEDTFEDIKIMMDKILSLRIFPDSEGKTNLSLNDVHGEIMVVSQFTLYADLIKGRRPSFTSAARGEVSLPLYQKTLDYVNTIMPCKSGVFGADMKINLVNDGPFTLVIDSKELKK